MFGTIFSSGFLSVLVRNTKNNCTVKYLKLCKLPVKEGERKPSLKEQPSYLKEVGVALTRREELLKLKVKSCLLTFSSWVMVLRAP
jgi:hypothetical protein